jgi:threonine/homoserine/homoserine lactone efflux protein
LEALRAFLFGITVAAPIGPIAVLLVRTGLNHRYSAALAGALGVALADFTYALIALSAGSGLAVVLQTHQREIQLAASALLIALGLYLAAGALRKVDPLAGADDAASQAPGLLRLYLLTLANPLTILLFIGFSGQMAVAAGLAGIAAGALFLFLGSLIVQVSYATLGALLQRWLTSTRLVRAFNTTSGLGIAAFGVYGLWRAV